MIAIPDDKLELVQRFVDVFHATQEHLNNDDHESAANSYKQMLDVYNKIAASDLDQIHKELAYDQLMKVYQTLQAPKRSNHATTHIIAAAAILVLFSFLVFFKPVIFSATVFEAPRGVVHDLNWAFVDSGSRIAHLEAAPKSLRLSGKVDGNGFVRVYANTGSSRVLLFDNDLVDLAADGMFSRACVNTCTDGIDSADVTLDVVLENAALTIYAIEYT